MRPVFALCACLLLLLGCDLDGLQSVTSAPVARFQMVQERTANSGSQILCGVDTTGLQDSTYDGVALDGLVVGHRTIGASNRCRRDVLRRYNGYAAFDLSELGAPRPGPGAARRVTSALLAARITQAPDFDGGSIGCRTGAIGAGMLDGVFYLAREEFVPEPYPDLSDPPPTTRIAELIHRGERMMLNRWLGFNGMPVEVVAASRGAMTLTLGDRALAALQRLVDDNAPRLGRFGLYFAGTNSGTTNVNQTCLHRLEGLQLTVFFRDEP